MLFDVYITWARIERSNASSEDGQQGPQWALSESPIIIQYMFFLTMNVLATVAQHAVIRFLSRVLLSRSVSQHVRFLTTEEHAQTVRCSAGASPAAISTALLVSSCSKLFPILLVIWPSANSEDENGRDPLGGGLGRAFVSNAAQYVGWVVLLNNIEALLILLDCGYVIATSLAIAGLVCRWTLEGWLLALVGLRSSSSREAVSGFVHSWYASSK